MKDETSLLQKLEKRRAKYEQLHDITDLIGIRIITYFTHDVQVVANLINDYFKIDQLNSIDKRMIVQPDQFGYLSLHYIIEVPKKDVSEAINEYWKVEIQIRTILQHAWAEIEHRYGYKLNKQVPWEIGRTFSRVSSLLETADIEFENIRRRMEDYEREIKEDLLTKPFNVEINNDILKLFLQTTNKQYKVKFAFHENDLDDIAIERIVHMLKHLGITTIGQLQTELDKNVHALTKYHALFKLSLTNYLETLCHYLVYQTRSKSFIHDYFSIFFPNDVLTIDDIKEAN